MILSVVIACGVLNTPQVVMASQKSDALSAYKVFLKENKWDEGEAGSGAAAPLRGKEHH